VDLLVVSHSPVVRTPDGWLTKNRVGTIVDRLGELGWDVRLVAQESPAVVYATHPLSERVRVKPLRPGARGVLQAVRLVRSADAVLTFMPTVRTALLGLLAGRRNVVYWGNAWALLEGSPGWRVRLESLLARRAGHVVVHGEVMYAWFAQHTRRLSLCVPLVPPEVAVRLRQQTPTAKSSDGPLRVLFVGSILPRKGVPELLDALHRLTDAECRIVGPPTDEELVRRLAGEVKENPSIRFEAYLEWPELRAAYEWAHVLALPSHVEGFPRVAYEAASFGAALILTPVGAIPHRLTDTHDAIFVPVGDSDALADALQALGADRPRMRQVAANAAATFAGVFTDADPADQFDRYLSQVAR
jgi:glycosyltransferase involved in cell wall biosynthesis